MNSILSRRRSLMSVDSILILGLTFRTCQREFVVHIGLTTHASIYFN